MDANQPERDFTTISPSARSLLFLKAHTQIPYMLEAARLMAGGDYNTDFTNRELLFWARVLHFESRYWSIDQALKDIEAKNILELSSGFSFRGVDAIKTPGVHYIDTDLPQVIAVKRKMIQKLALEAFELGKVFDVLPLNALDEEQFNKTVNRFGSGEVVIVNEGLLIYLDTEEKKRLCSIIRSVLNQRGGYWITADVYVRRPEYERAVPTNDKLQQFFEQHRIEENKFDSFEAAEQFFNENGFVIDKQIEVDRSKITAIPYLMESASKEQLAQMSQLPKMQATWRLKAVK